MADAESWTLQKGITMTVLQNPLRTRIHVTEGVLYVPPHWHIAHDENHVVLKGRLVVTQDGVRKVIGPEDGVCLTRRGVVHSLETFPGEEVILEETSTNLEDTEQKTLFFRNMCTPGMMNSPLGIVQVLYHADTYPKLPFGLRWLEIPIIVVLGGWLAPLLGYSLPDKRLRMNLPLKKAD